MKKVVCLICTLIILLLITTCQIGMKGHSVLLDVVYEECDFKKYVNSSDIGDGIDERWYYLNERDYSKQ